MAASWCDVSTEGLLRLVKSLLQWFSLEVMNKWCLNNQAVFLSCLVKRNNSIYVVVTHLSFQ